MDYTVAHLEWVAERGVPSATETPMGHAFTGKEAR